MQASRRQQEEQEKLLRDFELRRRIRSMVVPTDDSKVRQMLRTMGEPITLFGEREVSSRIAGNRRVERCTHNRPAAMQQATGAYPAYCLAD